MYLSSEARKAIQAHAETLFAQGTIDRMARDAFAKIGSGDGEVDPWSFLPSTKKKKAKVGKKAKAPCVPFAMPPDFVCPGETVVGDVLTRACRLSSALKGV